MSSACNQTIKKLNKTKQHVRVASHNTVWLYKDHNKPLMITYDSGSDGNCLSKWIALRQVFPSYDHQNIGWG